MQLKDSNTYINLAKAYAGECMALTRYKFVSYGAQTEGYKAMSNLINDVIYNECCILSFSRRIKAPLTI